MKRISIIMLLIVSMISSNIIYAETIGKTDITVVLNTEPLKFENTPFLHGNTPMVPMAELFEFMESHYFWYEDSQALTAYNNNMFIKMIVGESVGYHNGKKRVLSAPPVIINDVIYIPLNFVAKSYGIRTSWLSEDTYKLTPLEAQAQYHLIDGAFYITEILNEEGVNFSIPDYWKRLSNDRYFYAAPEEVEYANMQFQHYDLIKGTTVNRLTESVVDKTMTATPETLLIDQTDLYINGLKGERTELMNIYGDIIYQTILYTFIEDNKAYVFTCKYLDSEYSEETTKTFDNIIHSFQINNVTIDTQAEHYYEHPSYILSGVTLDTEIYSNMDVKRYLQTKGAANSFNDTDKLFAHVSKGNKTLTSPIIMNEGQFDSKIYTPFGLGKHNIYISSSDEPTVAKENAILQLSVVNTSAEQIRYVIPSAMIESNDEYISSQANLLTYKVNSDYSKAKNIFRWLVENNQLDSKDEVRSLQSAYDTYLSKKGNTEELAFLYTALLRSVNIPARVVNGYTDTKSHTWVEANINGQWIVSDPSYEIMFAQVENNYFHISLGAYESRFDGRVYLEY